ncbi:hypothetical protein DB346_06475 [Verrucomicrobia bacterium LW23]|nr:hypothetical protein DB346_06475 [Verrucomicrobia bacterium LW23]
MSDANSFPGNIFYNTQHSPIGAFASFTLGFKGPKGGLGLEMGKPADQNVFVGVEGSTPGTFACLPFFEQVEDEAVRFDIEHAGGSANARLTTVPDAAIRRELTPGRDTWRATPADAAPFSFTIHTPVCPAPDPTDPATPAEAMMLAYAPALAVEMEVDNRGASQPKRVIFGFQNNDAYRQMRMLVEGAAMRAGGGITGIACGDSVAIAARLFQEDAEASDDRLSRVAAAMEISTRDLPEGVSDTEHASPTGLPGGTAEAAGAALPAARPFWVASRTSPLSAAGGPVPVLEALPDAAEAEAEDEAHPSIPVFAAQGFSAEAVLSETLPFNRAFGIGSVGLLVATIPAGVRATVRYAVCFHRNGCATTGMASRYLYTGYFPTLESVAAYALTHFDALRNRGAAFDARVAAAGLSPQRAWMLAQAVHSYYGSSELLWVHDEAPVAGWGGGDPLGAAPYNGPGAPGAATPAHPIPFWIINEGEYRMMNTFDLTADQLFFELELNPWTVRNELFWFGRRYAYVDCLHFPGDTTKHRGGITFTHDMGVANHCAPPGRSVYEKAGLHGCFSHMSHEELVNWAMCALGYEHRVRGASAAAATAWLAAEMPMFEIVLESLVNRDHPDPAQRDGVMSLDSDRCAGGSEITTYDSLDVSLGQARNNLYLAVKCWGVYVGMQALFEREGRADHARTCADQARRCTATIAAAADEAQEGMLPAILHENVPSRIIPAIEGLITPWMLGMHDALSATGPYAALIAALRRHLRAVLKPGVCLFPGGAWKISSTSTNSWLSKIYLCQFIAERILAEVPAPQQQAADAAHAAWLLDDRNAYWAWSDQMLDGYARGSKYYPRGVTSILWMS